MRWGPNGQHWTNSRRTWSCSDGGIPSSRKYSETWGSISGPISASETCIRFSNRRWRSNFCLSCFAVGPLKSARIGPTRWIC